VVWNNRLYGCIHKRNIYSVLEWFTAASCFAGTSHGRFGFVYKMQSCILIFGEVCFGPTTLKPDFIERILISANVVKRIKFGEQFMYDFTACKFECLTRWWRARCISGDSVALRILQSSKFNFGEVCFRPTTLKPDCLDTVLMWFWIDVKQITFWAIYQFMYDFSNCKIAVKIATAAILLLLWNCENDKNSVI